MPKAFDMTGQRYGRLVFYKRVKNRGARLYWTCLCDCGGKKDIARSSVVYGYTRSCGCLLKETNLKNKTIHGGGSDLAYRSWVAMKQRVALGKKNGGPYGNRAISPDWIKNYSRFLKDMGPRPSKKYSLERLDNSLGYFKENCKWATILEQNNNHGTHRIITVNDETKTITNWAIFCGVSICCIMYRAKKHNGSCGKAISDILRKRSA